MDDLIRLLLEIFASFIICVSQYLFTVNRCWVFSPRAIFWVLFVKKPWLLIALGCWVLMCQRSGSAATHQSGRSNKILIPQRYTIYGDSSLRITNVLQRFGALGR